MITFLNEMNLKSCRTDPVFREQNVQQQDRNKMKLKTPNIHQYEVFLVSGRKKNKPDWRIRVALRPLRS